jgi:hypothetical protein
MKKVIITILLSVLFCKNFYGQLEKPFVKGALLAGGSFSVYFERESDYGTGPGLADIYFTNKKSIETSFIVGYFILRHFSLGIKNELIFYHYKLNSELNPSILLDRKNRDLIIGPFLRYYLNPGLFFEGYGGMGFEKVTSNNSLTRTKIYAFSTSIGYSILLNKNVALEPMVNYNFTRQKPGGFYEKISYSKISLSLGLQIYFKKANANTNDL